MSFISIFEVDPAQQPELAHLFRSVERGSTCPLNWLWTPKEEDEDEDEEDDDDDDDDDDADDADDADDDDDDDDDADVAAADDADDADAAAAAAADDDDDDDGDCNIPMFQDILSLIWCVVSIDTRPLKRHGQERSCLTGLLSRSKLKPRCVGYAPNRNRRRLPATGSIPNPRKDDGDNDNCTAPPLSGWAISPDQTAGGRRSKEVPLLLESL